MFKIKKHNYIENLISLLILCEILSLLMLINLALLVQKTYAHIKQPIQWESVKKAEVNISPILEIEKYEIVPLNEEPQYMLYEIVEKPLQEGNLTADLGVFEGPSGKETYYNLPMGGVIDIMKRNGFYMDYAVREDGVKTYGGYVMIAADLNKYPRGTLLDTSLGKGIVCDTGEFVNTDVVIDIAVDW